MSACRCEGVVGKQQSGIKPYSKGHGLEAPGRIKSVTASHCSLFGWSMCRCGRPRTIWRHYDSIPGAKALHLCTAKKIQVGDVLGDYTAKQSLWLHGGVVSLLRTSVNSTYATDKTVSRAATRQLRGQGVEPCLCVTRTKPCLCVTRTKPCLWSLRAVAWAATLRWG